MKETPSQTVGPFFAIGLRWIDGAGDGGLTLRGTVRDGDGEPVPDALVECASGGALRRSLTDEHGAYVLRVDPSTTTTGQPHVELTVFARGLQQRVVTRAYLADGSDPLLDAVPAGRRRTLLAAMDAAGTSATFDINLQGERETVFLAW